MSYAKAMYYVVISIVALSIVAWVISAEFRIAAWIKENFDPTRDTNVFYRAVNAILRILHIIGPQDTLGTALGGLRRNVDSVTSHDGTDGRNPSPIQRSYEDIINAQGAINL